ncbi:hypothetical protein ACWFRJ_38340 [Streptomyces sp. NPDC055239]
MNSQVELDNLRALRGRLTAELDTSLYEIVWQDPISGRAKQSASLGIDGPERLAELTVWESGEAELQLGEISSGEITNEHLSLADAGQLTAITDRMRAWVTGDGG